MCRNVARVAVVCMSLGASFLGQALAAPVFVDTARVIAVDSARGVDRRVDYAGLARFGPWDDRNYALTAADVALLAPNEAEQIDPIPAFFRVEMRRGNPALRRTGPAQYPRSAFNIFSNRYRGYLVGGALHGGVTWHGGRYYVDTASKPFATGEAGPDFVSGEVRITTPNGGAESAIKIHPSDTNKIVSSTNGPGGGQRMHYSTDGGATWTPVSLPLGGTCCDPSVDWSSSGQYAYTTALGQCVFSCAVWFYRSADGGATWNSLETQTPGDPRREIVTSGADKEFLHVDKYAGSPFKDNLYITWHNGNVMQFSRSTDFGNTWANQSFSSLSQDIGIGSDIATGPDGKVYYVWPAFNSKTIRLRRSSDGGATWGAITTVASTQDGYDFAIPAMESRRAFIYTSADADLSGGAFHGSVYVAWTDTTAPEQGSPAANHARIQVAWSRDGGNTWTVRTPHETADQNSVDRFHPWLGVGPDGAVYVAYYDTRRDTSRTSVDFFYSKSTDGGDTWTTPERLTTAISPNIADGFEWGDYNGLDVVMNDLMAIFTDNRKEGTEVGDSVDVYGAAVQAGTPAVCGDGVIQPGEACDGPALNGRTCADFACTGGTLACKTDCSGFDTTACTGCTTCNGNGVCEPGENCTNCAADCVSGTSGGATCGNGVCEAGNGEDCLSCPPDCNGTQNGKPTARFCCGDGAGTNPVSCSDSRCTSGGKSCTTVPVTPSSFCCGNTLCESGEGCVSCALDCTLSTVENCANGIDDDCANGADCSDPTCTASCQPPCRLPGAACTANVQCCSGRCRSKVCQ